MSNEDAIKWLENYTHTLRRRMKRLDKKIDDYESEKYEILYDIRENEKLIRQLQTQ